MLVKGVSSSETKHFVPDTQKIMKYYSFFFPFVVQCGHVNMFKEYLDPVY